MHRTEITELHYLVAAANVPSILRHGILSHNRAAGILHVEIADEDVIRRRSQRRIPGGLPLHDYVNLFFNGRNAMLFRRLRDPDPARRLAPQEMVILAISPRVLDVAGVVITDINAAAEEEPRWYTVQEGLAQLHKEEIFATYWTDADPWEKRRKRQRMMAEVLVPNCVASTLVSAAHVVSEAAAQSLSLVAPTLRVTIKPGMFFQ